MSSVRPRPRSSRYLVVKLLSHCPSSASMQAPCPAVDLRYLSVCPSSALTRAVLVGLLRMQVCSFYMRTGTCAYGAR